MFIAFRLVHLYLLRKDSVKTKTTIDRVILLETFVQVAKVGSISDAANAMKISQPTISRRVKALERLLDCELIMRGQRSLKLTPNGEICYVKGEKFLTKWIKVFVPSE